MEWNMKQLLQMCKNALYKSHQVLGSLGDRGTSEVHDEHVMDISTKGDVSVSQALIGFFKAQNVPAILQSEESGRIELMRDPEYTIAIDELDGTDNYYRGRKILPHCTVVSIFNSIEPIFNDAIIAGIIEHNSNILWHAVKDKGCYLNDTKCTTSGRLTLDRRTSAVIDHYNIDNDFSGFFKIYPNAWVKDFGSAALHLAGVGSGLFDAYLSPSQKGHELGAGYLLIKEAGGFLCDFNRNPLDEKSYDFNSEYSIIVASTEELGEMFLELDL